MTYPDALLLAIAALASALARRRPTLRPIAVALVVLLALALIESRVPVPLAIAIKAGAWPGTVVWLLGYWRDERPGAEAPSPRPSSGSTRRVCTLPLPVRPCVRRGLPECDTSIAHHVLAQAFALALLAYGAALATWGHAVAAHWTAALAAPRLIVAALAAHVAMQRPRTPVARVGVVLALGMLVGVAAGFWAPGAWPLMRAFATGVWATVGAIVVAEARRGP